MSQEEISLKKQLFQKEKQVKDLYVLIDTLQANLRSAVSCIEPDKKEEMETPSFKWVMNWKAGDELI